MQWPPDTDLDSVRVKLAYDLHYVRRCSLWLDVRIHLATVLHLARVPFAVRRMLLALPRRETVVLAYKQLLLPASRTAAGRGDGPASSNKHAATPSVNGDHAPIASADDVEGACPGT